MYTMEIIDQFGEKHSTIGLSSLIGVFQGISGAEWMETAQRVSVYDDTSGTIWLEYEKPSEESRYGRYYLIDHQHEEEGIEFYSLDVAVRDSVRLYNPRMPTQERALCIRGRDTGKIYFYLRLC